MEIQRIRPKIQTGHFNFISSRKRKVSFDSNFSSRIFFSFLRLVFSVNRASTSSSYPEKSAQLFLRLKSKLLKLSLWSIFPSWSCQNSISNWCLADIFKNSRHASFRSPEVKCKFSLIMTWASLSSSAS